MSAMVSRHYAHTAEDYLRPKRRRGAQLALTQVWELHHPKGLVGVISPWNYPLTLFIGDAVPAFVAGNAVVTKPDTQTPFSALRVVRLIEEAGLPGGLGQVVIGDGAVVGTPSGRPLGLCHVHRLYRHRPRRRRAAGRS